MNEIDEVMKNPDVLVDKIVNNLPELIILFTLIIIAIIANSIFKRRRKKREEKRQQEMELEMQHLQERKEAAIKTAKKKSTHIPKPASPVPSTLSHIPEDSTLKRHFLSQINSMLHALYGPQPTDSALCRHYKCLIDEKMQRCVTDEKFYQCLIEEYSHLPKPAVVTTTPAQKAIPQVEEAQETDTVESTTETVEAVAETTEAFEEIVAVPEVEPTVAEPVAAEVIATEPLMQKPITKEKPMIPQDSTLRRHFISNLRAIIEAEMSPHPTDSTLKRHFKGVVDAELENRLNQMQG